MSGICEWCPFVRDCPDCMFRGGESPSSTSNSTSPTAVGLIRENGTGNDERPPAPTSDPSEPAPTRPNRRERPAVMVAKPNHITIPITSAETCGQKSPKSGLPCRRADGHAGRHAFIRLFLHPGRVREVWA